MLAPLTGIFRFEQSGHGMVEDEAEKFDQELMDSVGQPRRRYIAAVDLPTYNEGY